jgi:ketosteroid isomerase-like protein
MARPTALSPELAGSLESFAQAWTGGDLDAFVSHFTPDAIFWPPDGAELRGREAIREWALQLGETANLVVELLHVERLGGIFFIVGDFTQDVTLQGQLVHYRGGFTSIHLEQDGALKVHRMVSFQERAAPR